MQPQKKTLAQSEPTTDDKQRSRDMADAWKSYRGNFDNPLKIVKNQPDDNVKANRCAPVVDKGVSFLFGPVLKIEATDETTEPDTVKQEYIESAWGDDDDRMTLLSLLALNGGVCGQVFVKLIPPKEGKKYPRVVTLDPELIRVVTAPDDCSYVLAYIIEYDISPNMRKKQIIARVDPNGLADDLPNEAEATWTITNYVKRTDVQTSQNAWIQTGKPEEWPWAFPPIFSCQNLPNPNEYWGTPDLTPDVIQMNKALILIESNISRILKFHAHPKTWATGIGAAQIKIAADELICLQSPEAKIGTLEMLSDLSSSQNFAASIRSSMDEQTRVPAVALGRLVELPRGNISGVALQLLFQPLLEKTTQKRRLYGKLIREVTRAALVMGNMLDIAEMEDYPIELHWQSLLPVDNLAEAQEALLLKQLGVSNTTLLEKLGYDPEDEREKSQAEDALTLQNWQSGKGMPPMMPPTQGQPSKESPFMGGE
jgi:hypothetical protein